MIRNLSEVEYKEGFWRRISLVAFGLLLFCSGCMKQPPVNSDVNIPKNSHESTPKPASVVDHSQDSEQTSNVVTVETKVEEPSTDAVILPQTSTAPADSSSDSSASVHVLKKGQKFCAAVAEHYGIAIYPGDHTPCFLTDTYCKLVRFHNRLPPGKPMSASREIQMPPLRSIFSALGLSVELIAVIRPVFEAESRYYRLYYSNNRLRNSVAAQKEEVESIIAMIDEVGEAFSALAATTPVPNRALAELKLVNDALRSLLSNPTGEGDKENNKELLTVDRRFAYAIDALFVWATKITKTENDSETAIGFTPQDTCMPNK